MELKPGYLCPPGYKQTEVGVIPKEWEVAKLGNLIEYTKGFAFKSIDYSSHGVRVVRVSDTSYDSILEECPVFVPESKASQYAKWRLRKDDLVISTVGSKPPMYDSMVGKVILIPQQHEGELLNQNAVLIRDKKRRTYFQQILLSHFRTKRYLTWIESIFRGNANQASITLNELFEFDIAFPAADSEQRAIAEALSDVDALIGALDQLIIKKRDLKQATMQQLLTGKKRLQGFHGEWELKPLGEVCRITTGKKDVNEGNPSGQYPFFTCARTNTFSDSFSFEGEAILIAGNGEVGNLNYCNGRFEAYQRTYVLQGFTTNISYLWHQLTAYLASSLGIGKIGSSIPYIKMGDLVGFEFRSPLDLNEQTAIAEVLSDMDAELAALEQRRDKTRALKQGMMQELLTGRTRLV